MDRDHARDRYIALCLDDMLDDVDCSPSTFQARDTEMGEIELGYDAETCTGWWRVARRQAVTIGVMRSGAKYEE